MLSKFAQNAFQTTFGLFPSQYVDFGGGAIVAGVSNGSHHYDDKDLGGYEAQDSLRLVFKASDLPQNPSSLVGTTVVIDKIDYRVAKVRQGEVAVTIDFVSPDHA